jgi:hypothetical protein
MKANEPGKQLKLGPRGGKSITSTGLIRRAFLLHADEYEALRRKAFDENRSASELVREAIRSYLGIEDWGNPLAD